MYVISMANSCNIAKRSISLLIRVEYLSLYTTGNTNPDTRRSYPLLVLSLYYVAHYGKAAPGALGCRRDRNMDIAELVNAVIFLH